MKWNANILCGLNRLIDANIAFIIASKMIRWIGFIEKKLVFIENINCLGKTDI